MCGFAISKLSHLVKVADLSQYNFSDKSRTLVDKVSRPVLYTCCYDDDHRDRKCLTIPPRGYEAKLFSEFITMMSIDGNT